MPNNAPDRLTIEGLDDDTVHGIMTRKKLEKLKRELSELRGRPAIKSKELEQFAKKVGRRRSSRGKEPTYEMPGAQAAIDPASFW